MFKEVACPHCKHIQKTRSKLKRITCSSCGFKIPTEEIEQQIHINNITNVENEGLKKIKLD